MRSNDRKTARARDRYVRLPDDVELTDSPWQFAVDVTAEVAALRAEVAARDDHWRPRVNERAIRAEADLELLRSAVTGFLAAWDSQRALGGPPHNHVVERFRVICAALSEETPVVRMVDPEPVGNIGPEALAKLRAAVDRKGADRG